MILSCHQLAGAFADAFGTPAVQEAPMVQEKLQQTQIRSTQLAAQREVVVKPYEYALQIVAQEMGHFSTANTKDYLR